MAVRFRASFVVVGLILIGACKGAKGPEGPPGPTGDPASAGSSCNQASPGQTAGLDGSVAVSTPANGQYFGSGERGTLTIKLVNRCGRTFKSADLGQAWLLAAGPRSGLATKTAASLLNAATDRSAPRGTPHHYIDIRDPTFATPNLTQNADGTITYQLNAVSNEPAGTYTAGVWAVSKDGKDQAFLLADFQIGTPTAETYASGPIPGGASTCYDCHKGTISGKSYQAHILPGFSPFGNYALDQTPIASCQLCHNQDGYSLNPIVRKVHAAHRGEHQAGCADPTHPECARLTAGAAHPEYGLGQDNTLKEYWNIAFPSFPSWPAGGEKDCQKCHTDDRWKTKPSRLACGTCHDNLFFDTGLLNPPRNLGKPAAGSCAQDSDCSSFGSTTTCKISDGTCQRTTHLGGAATDDRQCGLCHGPDALQGVAPIAPAHEIFERTRVRGIQLAQVAFSGASGPSGTYLVGDHPTVSFKLTDKSGTVISNLVTNPALSASFIAAGPTDNRQRVLGQLSLCHGASGAISCTNAVSGTLSYDAGSGLYTYVAPALPANALEPLNATDPFTPPNPSGTYTFYLYIVETVVQQGQQVRDYAENVTNFKFSTDGTPVTTIKPRQVIAKAACDSCHVTTEAHGSNRRNPEVCGTCHTSGAVDRTVGSAGASCTVDTNCPGFAGGWESCDTSVTPHVCRITVDPTPGQTISFGPMIHSIHFGRLLEGYAERNNLAPFTGKLTIIGFQNSVIDMSEKLFPQDIRNCTKCHADSGATCSTTEPCGVGQQCVAGKCANNAWLQPSREICLSCHDSADGAGHASLNTATGGIETCDVCHGQGKEFSVDKVHNISKPYRPPYLRSKE